MYVFGLCRMDAGAEGIHLAWAAPDVLGLSASGFDIQRRIYSGKYSLQCASLAAGDLATLRMQSELSTALGTILYRQSGPLYPFDTTTTPWPSATMNLDVFTQELAAPATMVQVTARVPPSLALHPFGVFVIAMSRGKTVAVGTSPGDGTAVTLYGSDIDAVEVYTVSGLSLAICSGSSEATTANLWSNLPYLIQGLTLPIQEADPRLNGAAAELAAAQSRLTDTETFTQDDFDNLSPSLRRALSQPTWGRPGERILLGRETLDESLQELTFGNQLGLLQLHPGLRRILGFGYLDRASSGLIPGATYEYRVTGHFNAADLTDKVYDVHTIRSQTVLPATVYIEDLRMTFSRPATIVLEPVPAADALNSLSRRGIQIPAGSPLPGWIGPSLEDWSVVLDLPRAVSRVVLEVSTEHTLQYAAGTAWAFTATPASAPSGPVIALTFASPVTQIRLTGQGVLFAIRIPGGLLTGLQPLTADSAPIVFAAQLPPVAPLSLTLTSLQNSGGTSVVSTDQFDAVPQRPLPGFELVWLPAATSGISYWPSPLNAVPPIDAIAFQIEHREVTTPTFGDWEPILPGDNLSLGSRYSLDPPIGLQFGSDLSVLYPLRPQRAAFGGYTFRLSDVFDIKDDSGTFSRPVPAFGTFHQYRIRAMDTVGRVSADWTLSNIARLEKHTAPPLPVGPQPEPALVPLPDGSNRFSGVPGVKARALVIGDSSLNAADIAVLGAHQNAVTLDWGWRDSERTTDNLTAEFRVYYWLNPPDVIPGTITSVTAGASGGWDLGFTTNRVLTGGDCVGQWITTGGYPFQIVTVTAAPTLVIHVSASLVNPRLEPVVGPVQFGRPLHMDHQRPAFWDGRAAVVPLTSAGSYRYVFYDLLSVSPANPLETIWVGVSAADAEPYIVDELPVSAANGGRPGNESSIVTCAVASRDHTSLVFVVPPPVGDVPEQLGEEPTGRQILVPLDLGSLLPGSLASGEPIALDRCSIDTILSITSLNASAQIQLMMKDGSSQTIAFPNPSDEAEAVAMLESDHPERMATRLLLYLAVQHARRNEIFERISDDILAFGTVTDRVAPKPARYFYRMRRADAAGRVSLDGAILPLVVRVPSIAPPSAPERLSLTATNTSVSITLRVPSDPDVSCFLVFSTAIPVSSPIQDLSGAELLRVPNRRDLYPLNGIWLRTPGASPLLTPVVKALSDPDVVTDADGNLSATVTTAATFGNWSVLWAVTLSKEGIPSRLTGPFTMGVPPA